MRRVLCLLACASVTSCGSPDPEPPSDGSLQSGDETAEEERATEEDQRHEEARCFDDIGEYFFSTGYRDKPLGISLEPGPTDTCSSTEPATLAEPMAFVNETQVAIAELRSGTVVSRGDEVVLAYPMPAAGACQDIGLSFGYTFRDEAGGGVNAISGGGVRWLPDGREIWFVVTLPVIESCAGEYAVTFGDTWVKFEVD